MFHFSHFFNFLFPDEVDILGYGSSESEDTDHSSIRSNSSDGGCALGTSNLNLGSSVWGHAKGDDVLRRAVPLQRSPIVHWRAGAGAAAHDGDPKYLHVDNHLSLILHNTNGKLQFMQRECQRSTQKKSTRFNYNNKLRRLDRGKS